MVEQLGSSVPRNARGSTCTAWCRAAYDRNWTQERVRSTCLKSCAGEIVNHPIKESRVCQTQVMHVHIERNGSSMGDDPMLPKHINHDKSRVSCPQMCVQYNRWRQNRWWRSLSSRTNSPHSLPEIRPCTQRSDRRRPCLVNRRRDTEEFPCRAREPTRTNRQRFSAVPTASFGFASFYLK